MRRLQVFFAYAFIFALFMFAVTSFARAATPKPLFAYDEPAAVLFYVKANQSMQQVDNPCPGGEYRRVEVFRYNAWSMSSKGFRRSKEGNLIKFWKDGRERVDWMGGGSLTNHTSQPIIFGGWC